MTVLLVDVEDVADQLHKVSDSDWVALEEHLAAASALISDMCVPLLPATVIDNLDGGGPTVILSTYPVDTITSVHTYDTAGNMTVVVQAGGTTGLTDGWRLDPMAGVLTRVGWRLWPSGFGNVQVTYTVGPAVVPDAVARAVIVLTEHLWQFRKIRGSSSQPNLPGGGDAMGYSLPFAVPNSVIEMVRPYLKPPRAA